MLPPALPRGCQKNAHTKILYSKRFPTRIGWICKYEALEFFFIASSKMNQIISKKFDLILKVFLILSIFFKFFTPNLPFQKYKSLRSLLVCAFFCHPLAYLDARLCSICTRSCFPLAPPSFFTDRFCFFPIFFFFLLLVIVLIVANLKTELSQVLTFDS